MAQKKFTELAAASALDGSEIIAVVQGGVSKKSTTQDIADLAPGGGSSSTLVPNTQAGDYTLAVSDAGKGIRMTKGTPGTLTIPNNSGVAIPLQTIITVDVVGAGPITVVEDTDVSSTNTAGTLVLKNGPNILWQPTTVDVWEIWNGAPAGGAVAASSVTNTPAGDISATDVQAAINELDTEKQPIDADLTAIAALTPTNDDIIQRKAGAWTNRTIAQLKTDIGAPSETAQGVIEIATQAEVTTGTDDVRAVTPLKLAVAVPAASETASGKAEIATQAEVTTGTDDLRIVTPLKLKAATIGVQDLFISAAGMWPRTTGGCSALTQTEMATSLFNVQSLDFDAAADEFAQFQITLPRKWNNGTVTVVFYWTAASGSGDVIWTISGGAYSNDDALTVALGTAQSVTDTLITANDLHITSATSAMTLAGTPADADFLAFQISRDADNGSDTLSADAKLLGISIRLNTDATIDA